MPQLPKKKPLIKEYEKRNHVEKIKRKPLKYISQPDNAFNFNPPQNNKTQKKMITEQVPSKYYKKIQDSKNAYNHLLNENNLKKIESNARKDNLKEIFRTNTEGNVYKERLHRKVNYKDTEVNQIFEKGKNNLPVGYKELTTNVVLLFILDSKPYFFKDSIISLLLSLLTFLKIGRAHV